MDDEIVEMDNFVLESAPKEGRCVALNDVHLSKKDDSLTLFYGGPQTGSRTTFLREVGPTAIRNRLYP